MEKRGERNGRKEGDSEYRGEGKERCNVKQKRGSSGEDSYLKSESLLSVEREACTGAGFNTVLPTE